MKVEFGYILVFILVSVCFLIISNVVASKGQWLTLQGNHKRTGRIDIAGKIEQPKVYWKLDLSAKRVYFGVNENGTKEQTVVYKFDNLPIWTSDMEREWGLEPEFRTRHLEVRGKFLDDVPGYQTVRFTNTWTGEGEADLQLVTDNGIMWNVKFEPKAEAPMPVVVDLDGDGELEIAVSHWYGVTVYSLLTGEKKYQNIYRKSERARQYGHFSAITLPSGDVVLLVVGEFSPHIDVLKVKNGKLEVLWYKKLGYATQGGIDRRITINRVGTEPAGDFDGDGRFEVMMNYFNGSGDEHWHLMGYELMTGKVEYDIKNFYLDGAVDVDGDGREEWLGRIINSRARNTYAPLQVLKPVNKGDIQEIWSGLTGRWSMSLPLTKPTISSDTSGVKKLKPVSVNRGEGQGDIIFFSELKNSPGGERLSAMVLDTDKGDSKVLWSIDVPVQGKLDVLSHCKKGYLVSLEKNFVDSIEVHVENAKLNLIGQKRLTRVPSQPVVIKDKQGIAYIITATSAEQIACFCSEGNQKPELLWSYPGRPMSTGSGWYGLEADDINGDNIPEVVYVTEAPESGARIIVRNLDGDICWYYDFPGFNGYLANWNECMTTFWSLGHFLDSNHLDLFVSNRRSIMHSDESVVVNMKKKNIAWHKDILQVREPWTTTQWFHTRGYGGGLPALEDFDDDGLDDIVLTYPAEVSIVDGEKGEQLYVENMGPVPDTDVWLIGGTPMVADFDGDGNNETLEIHSDMLILFKHKNKRSEILWRTQPANGTKKLPTLIKLKEDGKLGLCLVNSDGEVKIINPKTGKEILNFKGKSTSSNIVACDVNGDGYEEIIYASAGELVALGIDRKQNVLRIIWSIKVSKTGLITDIVVADVNGDGAAEILAGTNDSKLYCIGAANI